MTTTTMRMKRLLCSFIYSHNTLFIRIHCLKDDEASATESREAESPSEKLNRMRRKAKKRKKRKQAKKKRRFKPTSIELSSLLKTEDAEYDKWRAKIGKFASS